MSSLSVSAPTPRRLSRRRVVVAALVLLLLLGITRGVKVVPIGSSVAADPKRFSAADYGRTEFPKVVEAVRRRAVPATTLQAGLAKDPDAAGRQYGVVTSGGLGPTFSVTFTGVAGAPIDGVCPVKVAGMPADLLVRVQTGPVVNGTDLRDATGTISFGQFVNQIDYQNAGAALNDELKKQVLASVDPASLAGRTLTVTGAFQLINPKAWLVTPVELTVS